VTGVEAEAGRHERECKSTRDELSLSGFDILRRVRINPQCTGARVVILSSSDTRAEREMATNLGVVSYLRKPSDLREFVEMGAQLKSVMARWGVAGTTNP
jgi:DNA-binding response OmpR family regulator